MSTSSLVANLVGVMSAKLASLAVVVEDEAVERLAAVVAVVGAVAAAMDVDAAVVVDAAAVVAYPRAAAEAATVAATVGGTSSGMLLFMAR